MARGKAKEETKTKTEKKKTKPKAKPPAKSKAKTPKKKEAAAEVEELERVEEAEEGRLEPVEGELEAPSPAEEAKEVVVKEAEALKEEVEEVEEEAKPEKAPEEEELEIVEEKFYDLNLRRIWTAPREKRTPRAVRFLREFVGRRMKTDDVAISEEANSMLWARGISKPPRKIRVRAVKDKEGRVIVFPGEVK